MLWRPLAGPLHVSVRVTTCALAFYALTRKSAGHAIVHQASVERVPRNKRVLCVVDTAKDTAVSNTAHLNWRNAVSYKSAKI